MTLSHLIKNRNHILTTEIKNQIITQLFLAIINCNKNNIYHRDIKPANILISLNKDNNSISIFLSDFGEAVLIEHGI